MAGAENRLRCKIFDAFGRPDSDDRCIIAEQLLPFTQFFYGISGKITRCCHQPYFFYQRQLQRNSGQITALLEQSYLFRVGKPSSSCIIDHDLPRVPSSSTFCRIVKILESDYLLKLEQEVGQIQALDAISAFPPDFIHGKNQLWEIVVDLLECSEFALLCFF